MCGVGRHWIKQLCLSVFLLPLVVGGVAGFVQVVALAYHTARVLHASSIAGVLAIVLLVVFPLQLLGCVLGRNLAGVPTVPCRVNSVPRPIPEKKWCAHSYSYLFSALLLCIAFYTCLCT